MRVDDTSGLLGQRTSTSVAAQKPGRNWQGGRTATAAVSADYPRILQNPVVVRGACLPSHRQCAFASPVVYMAAPSWLVMLIRRFYSANGDCPSRTPTTFTPPHTAIGDCHR